eukprot:5575995-Pyramimonas_sp.AAC.1
MSAACCSAVFIRSGSPPAVFPPPAVATPGVAMAGRNDGSVRSVGASWFCGDGRRAYSAPHTCRGGGDAIWGM